MSRASAPRSLTLTEELEKLEQSITLTLQEIDHNFNKAHRIVTTSILPIVEDYAKHSNDVWEGSKFWKKFFEASANVSLSGYEEAALEDDMTHTETSTTLDTPVDLNQATMTGAEGEDDEDFSTVDSPTQVTGVHSTPRLPASTGKTASKGSAGKAASLYRSPSPRKYTGKNPMAQPDFSDTTDEPSTPQTQSKFAAAASSPFEPVSKYQGPSAQRKQNNDVLLHRVLDKNYRVQATPHTQRKTKHAQPKAQATPATTARKAWEDSPQSSPETDAPQLRSDLFSPEKRGPRTPGVSILSPRQYNSRPIATSTGRQLFSSKDKTPATTRTSHLFDDDSDDDTDGLDGMSPPKTMQFHVPQSRLLQTPAREASRRIVEELLLTAGADATDEIDGSDDGEEESPSVVRKAYDIGEDTF